MEVAQDGLQAPRERVFGVARLDLRQERLRERPQDRKLVVERRVERDVRLALEREDPLLLAAPHRRPHRERPLRVVAAEEVVAHEAAHEAVVGRGEDRVVVDPELRERREVDLEGLLPRDALGEDRVEGVDALDEHDVVRPEAQRLVGPRRRLRPEVEDAPLHGPAGDERGEVLPEARDVDRADVLVVGLAVGADRVVLLRDEVVVGRELHRPQPHHAQVDREAAAGGGLAGGRRPGDEHEARPRLPRGDEVGEAAEALVVQRLAHLHHVRDAALGDGLVELAHAVDAEDVAPARVLAVDAHQRRLRREGRHAARVGARGHLQQQPALVAEELEEREQAGARDARPLAQVAERAAAHERDDRVVAVAQEPHLVVPALGRELRDRLLVAAELLDERLVRRGDRAHLLLDRGALARRGGALGRLVAVAQRRPDAAAERVAHAQEAVRQRAAHGHRQQEAHRAAQDRPAVVVRRREAADPPADRERRVERDDLAAGDGAEIRQALRRAGGQDVADGRPGIDDAGLAGFGKLDGDGHGSTPLLRAGADRGIRPVRGGRADGAGGPRRTRPARARR